jgi:putative transposase
LKKEEDMPRQARVKAAGIPQHVVQRGNNQSVCFLTEDDYRFYLYHLGDLSDRHGCAVHAYVLMTDHVHLLMTPESADGISRLMKQLSQRYVQYFNRAYGRRGTLWDGRFRSGLVQAQDLLLRCCRYVELNPVRAGMVRHPGEYEWSSYRCNAEGSPSILVRPHAEYLALGATDGERQEAYRALCRTAPDAAEVAAISRCVYRGRALDSDRLRDEMARAWARRTTEGWPRGRRSDARLPAEMSSQQAT